VVAGRAVDSGGAILGAAADAATTAVAGSPGANKLCSKVVEISRVRLKSRVFFRFNIALKLPGFFGCYLTLQRKHFEERLFKGAGFLQCYFELRREDLLGTDR
jgi:hypothetical protein